jgi:hypothetical protein
MGGQSLAAAGITPWLHTGRKSNPDTVFVVENRALGGFASHYLVRTTEQDVAALSLYPPHPSLAHWIETRVRAHILLCMLAYYVE